MKIIKICIFILLLFTSCIKTDNKFTDDFKNYLSDNFNIKLRNDFIYIIIPAHACNLCIDEVISKIKTNNKNTNFIIIAEAKTYAELNFIITQLKDFNVIYDRKCNFNKYMHYDGLYPYFIKVDNNNIVLHGEINISDKNTYLKYIK